MNEKIEQSRASDDSVEDIRRLFASECAISFAERPVAGRRQCASEPDTGYSVNYDDLCGPWSYRENPFHASHDSGSPATPRLCVWKLLTPECTSSVRRCLDDEAAIKHLIGKRIDDEAPLADDTRREIFLELAWSVVGFARDNRLSEEATSALVGIFHLTYTFFLANPWRTVEETYDLFCKTILLHAVEDPPKSREIFTPEECTRSVKYFLTILLKHLPLVRFVCLPNYRCLATLPKQN